MPARPERRGRASRRRTPPRSSCWWWALPARVARAVREEGVDDLIEVVLDLGRPPAARYATREVVFDADEVTALDIDHVVGSVSEFGEDNRAGIRGRSTASRRSATAADRSSG